jgi:hypothetical protein
MTEQSKALHAIVRNRSRKGTHPIQSVIQLLFPRNLITNRSDVAFRIA